MPVPSRPGARPVPGARRTRPGPGPLVALVVALALAILIVALAGASVASAATVTITGTVRDDAGAPVPDRVVWSQVTLPDRTYGSTFESTGATTDAAGRYRLTITRPPAPFESSARIWVDRSDDYSNAEPAGVGDRVAALKGATLQVDPVVRRRNATVTGRVSVRDGGSPENATVTLHPAPDTSNQNDQYTVDAAPDGTWTASVPPGRYRTRAESRYGLPAWAPDLPEVRTDSPVLTAVAGGTQTADVSLRHRLAGPAYDEYGIYRSGYDGSPPGAVPDHYPPDPHRSVTSVVGPRLKAQVLPGPPYGGIGVTMRVTNTGDDDGRAGAVRFEGRDRFSCYLPGGSCTSFYVLPGSPVDLIVMANSWGDQRDFRTSFVLPTTTPSGTLRLPIAVHDPSLTTSQLEAMQKAQQDAFLAAILPKAPAARAPIARPGAGGDVGRVLMTKNRLRVTFPAAGTATSTVDRVVKRTARGKATRRWKTVRRITLRSTSAATQVARMKRLARGRYRVRTTYAIGTRAPRTTTTTWSIRR